VAGHYGLLDAEVIEDGHQVSGVGCHPKRAGEVVAATPPPQVRHDQGDSAVQGAGDRRPAPVVAGNAMGRHDHRAVALPPEDGQRTSGYRHVETVILALSHAVSLPRCGPDRWRAKELYELT
jgi:hypothetical protein